MKLKIFIILIIFMFFSKKGFSENYDKVLYDFKIESITGEIIDLNEFKNKVVLITNTASYCGFTKQYSDLQKLWQKYKEEGLIVLGVPSNSFNQEKSNENVQGDNNEITLTQKNAGNVVGIDVNGNTNDVDIWQETQQNAVVDITGASNTLDLEQLHLSNSGEHFSKVTINGNSNTNIFLIIAYLFLYAAAIILIWNGCSKITLWSLNSNN